MEIRTMFYFFFFSSIYMDKFSQVSNEMKDIYYKGFSEEEIDEFENYLRRLLENLSIYIEEKKKK